MVETAAGAALRHAGSAIGDYLVRIGRYFDRAASDASGLTFEEWTPPDGRDSFIINATELRGVNFTMTPT